MSLIVANLMDLNVVRSESEKLVWGTVSAVCLPRFPVHTLSRACELFFDVCTHGVDAWLDRSTLWMDAS